MGLLPASQPSLPCFIKAFQCKHPVQDKALLPSLASLQKMLLLFLCPTHTLNYAYDLSKWAWLHQNLLQLLLWANNAGHSLQFQVSEYQQCADEAKATEAATVTLHKQEFPGRHRCSSRLIAEASWSALPHLPGSGAVVNAGRLHTRKQLQTHCWGTAEMWGEREVGQWDLPYLLCPSSIWLLCLGTPQRSARQL